MDTKGPLEVASQRTDNQRGENQTVDLIIMRLRGMVWYIVAALLETKWFGTGVYQVNGSVVLMVISCSKQVYECDSERKLDEDKCLLPNVNT